MGVEAVRAYIFLEALVQGHTSTEAAELVGGDITELDTNVLRQIVQDIRVIHGGRQLPLIGEAYRRGMSPLLPSWYRSFAYSALPTTSIETVYRVPMTTTEPHKPADRNVDQSKGFTQRSKPKGALEEFVSFEAYYHVFLTELKRLAGKKETDLHFIELMENEPLQRAFIDGVNPRELASMLHREHSKGAWPPRA
jgi:hypothetical protein